MSNNKITICTNHPEYKVPMIWTYAFPGAEWWCPYCGDTQGMFGGKSVEATKELKDDKKAWEKVSKPYLNAVSTFACESLIWRKKRI